jgi:predicted nucleotidyltransferase
MNRLDEIRAKREDGWHAGLTWDDTDYLLERIEALEKVAADARTAVHYSRITIELAASIAALDALEQP